MKRAAAALRDGGVRYALAGGLALWTRGGPSVEHDVDFIVAPEQAEEAIEVLAGAGFRIEHPPEGWLSKAWEGDVLVDIIFSASCGSIERFLDAAEVLEVNAQPMPVVRVDDAMVMRLHALNERRLDYGPLVQAARSLREQIDWAHVRDRARTPYAAGFFALVDALGIRD